MIIKNYQKIFAAFIICAFFPAIAAAQTGGTFQITQSVIASGGAKSDGGNFDLTGIIGQTLAGTNSTGGAFAVRGGFWQGFFNPTAALVSVSGRVARANGKGIFRTRVTLTDISGTTRYALTDFRGKFRFDDVEAGQSYIFSVFSNQFQFTNNPRILTVLEETSELDFTVEP